MRKKLRTRYTLKTMPPFMKYYIFTIEVIVMNIKIFFIHRMVVQRTKLVDETQELLSNLLQEITSGIKTADTCPRVRSCV